MIETERLILRQWQARDHATFIKMGLDPDVMKYFPRCLTPEESLNFVDSVTSFIDKNGWGFGAIELKQMHEFIGFIGLRSQPTQFDFAPCMEIAWRLAKQFWQKGYATEGTQAVLDYAFNMLKLNEVISFTASVNTPSETVMKKLGMHKVKEFNHSQLPVNHVLARHVLYEKYKPI